MDRGGVRSSDGPPGDAWMPGYFDQAVDVRAHLFAPWSELSISRQHERHGDRV